MIGAGRGRIPRRMKLYGSLTSPYVRLCRLVADARGLTEVELVVTDVFAEEGYRAINPLGKVPALTARDGTLLPDSGVIARYLDTLGEAPSLYERGGMARHRADAFVALCTGVLDLGVANLLERRRPEGERSPSWLERRRAGIDAGLAELAAQAEDLPEEAGVADLALGTALDWLAFRMPEVAWRDAPALADRADRVLAGEAFAATDPRLA